MSVSIYLMSRKSMYTSVSGKSLRCNLCRSENFMQRLHKETSAQRPTRYLDTPPRDGRGLTMFGGLHGLSNLIHGCDLSLVVVTMSHA